MVVRVLIVTVTVGMVTPWRSTVTCRAARSSLFAALSVTASVIVRALCPAGSLKCNVMTRRLAQVLRAVGAVGVPVAISGSGVGSGVVVGAAAGVTVIVLESVVVLFRASVDVIVTSLAPAAAY